MLKHFLFFLLAISSPLFAQVEKLRPGMNEAEVRTVVPGFLPEQAAFNKIIRDTVSAFGLSGVMNYSFVDSKLAQMDYSALENRDNDPQKTIAIYQKMLAGARQAVEKYTKLFGKPAEHREQNVENYNAGGNTISTQFISASWKCAEGGAVRLAFYFSGEAEEGARRYGWSPKFYLLTINYTSPCSDFGWKFRPGMSAQECAALRPGLFPEGTATTGTFEKEGKIGDVKGKWTICMQQGTLSHYRFTGGEFDRLGKTNVTEESYKKISAAVKEALVDYQARYGKPVSLQEKPRTFAEADGYDHVPFLAADWETHDQKISMSYKLSRSIHQKEYRSLEFEVIFYKKEEKYPPHGCQ